MLDTVALSSPAISERVAQLLESSCFSRIGLANGTGELQYHFQHRQLPGSWSNQVMLKVERERWFSHREPGSRGRPVTRKIPSAPWLRVEGSVHKAMIGHNVEGGPEDAYRSCVWFLRSVFRQLRIPEGELPPFDEWVVDRIDWAEAWDLGSWNNVREFFAAMNNATFPRRKPKRYGLETIMFVGSGRTLKFYHKGPEFGKHGARVLRARMTAEEVEGLQAKADRLVRVELGIRKKELERTRAECLVRDLPGVDFRCLHQRETWSCLREGESEMRTVRNAEEVTVRLKALHSATKANALLATWLSLAAFGEEKTRSRMTRRTFYRHRRDLQDSGVSWTSTDVHLSANPVFGDGPLLSWDDRLTGEHPTVKRLLAEVPAAPAAAPDSGGRHDAKKKSRRFSAV